MPKFDDPIPALPKFVLALPKSPPPPLPPIFPVLDVLPNREPDEGGLKLNPEGWDVEPNPLPVPKFKPPGLGWLAVFPNNPPLVPNPVEVPIK